MEQQPDLRYPIGRFQHEGPITAEMREAWIEAIEALPALAWEAVEGLNDIQLDTPYREGGWTVRQVIHHLADSHMNSVIRFKLALTEENPTIKPYEENDWAQLADSASAPIEMSLTFLDALHKRWVILLRSMGDEDFERTFFHPGSQRDISLARNLGIYAWHGRHHTAHITALRSRMGW